MRMTVFDYGAGNLHSLAKAMPPGVTVTIEADPIRAIDTDLLVLPGVGAFHAAAARLAPGRARMAAAIRDGLPALGICLGLHLLCDGSDEGPGDGLGVIPGRVTRIDADRVPHIGWNTVDLDDATAGPPPPTWAYYAHSFVARPVAPDVVVASTTHESDTFPAIVRAHRAVGVQFHPEKSGAAGVRFLHAIVEASRS